VGGGKVVSGAATVENRKSEIMAKKGLSFERPPEKITFWETSGVEVGKTGGRLT